MGTREPNRHLERLYRQTGWTLRQFVQAVNRIGTERGTPLKYREPSAHQWCQGHLPKEQARPLIVEALARKLGRPVTHAEAGFPPLPVARRPLRARWKGWSISVGEIWIPHAAASSV